MVSDLVNYNSRQDGRPYLSDGASASQILLFGEEWERENVIITELFLGNWVRACMARKSDCKYTRRVQREGVPML